MNIQFSTSFFRLFAFLVGVSLWLSSCQSKPTGVAAYFTEPERETLLINVITYMARYAPGATNATRFDPKFRAHYTEQLPKYRFEDYAITPDSTHYYFVIRPVGEGKRFQRGVGGRFRLQKESLMPVDFEEMWCTPHLKDTMVIKERGGFLFRQMVKSGNVDKYLTMKDYVEWPDATLQYDKRKHEWVSQVAIPGVQ